MQQLSMGATGNQLLFLDRQLALLAQFFFFYSYLLDSNLSLDSVICPMKNWALIINSSL